MEGDKVQDRRSEEVRVAVHVGLVVGPVAVVVVVCDMVLVLPDQLLVHDAVWESVRDPVQETLWGVCDTDPDSEMLVLGLCEGVQDGSLERLNETVGVPEWEVVAVLDTVGDTDLDGDND